MHAAAINLRGGVSPRGTLLRGQSIIEYVLIIAVIGLVIVFAGPGVAGAIRNQFNLVGNTLNSGTNGGTEGGGASGGGSTGADSATVQAAVAKDAKDWTLGEQKAVAEDIAAKGEASPAYSKAKAAMDAETKWTIKLTNGQTMQYRIIGINHDDLADGSGKAGITFLATSRGIEPDITWSSNSGGWEKSNLRQMMNSGEIWNLMPSDFQSKVKAVRKLTNNVDGTDKNAAVTATSDKLFCLSYSEIVESPYGDWGWPAYSWLGNEGTQYEAFRDKDIISNGNNDCLRVGPADWPTDWWERTVWPGTSTAFFLVGNGGDPTYCTSMSGGSHCVCPAWCF